MRRRLAWLITTGVLAIPSLCSAQAEELAESSDLSANVALTSDYRFRGISQTLNDPAIQGGMDWNGNLFSLGFWGSSIDFGEDSALVSQRAQLELDLYAGFEREFRHGTSLGVQLVEYLYPGADADLNYNYVELLSSFGFPIGPVSATVHVAYSPEFFASSGTAFYYAFEAGLDLKRGFSIEAQIGRQSIEDNASFGTPDYTDWSLTLSRSWPKLLGVSLAYIGTDLNRSECFGGSDLCGGTLVATLSRSF